MWKRNDRQKREKKNRTRKFKWWIMFFFVFFFICIIEKGSERPIVRSLCFFGFLKIGCECVFFPSCSVSFVTLLFMAYDLRCAVIRVGNGNSSKKNSNELHTHTHISNLGWIFFPSILLLFHISDRIAVICICAHTFKNNIRYWVCTVFFPVMSLWSSSSSSRPKYWMENRFLAIFALHHNYHVQNASKDNKTVANECQV